MRAEEAADAVIVKFAPPTPLAFRLWRDEIVAAVRAAVAEEREACARLAEEMAVPWRRECEAGQCDPEAGHAAVYAAGKVAAAIRARD